MFVRLKDADRRQISEEPKERARIGVRLGRQPLGSHRLTRNKIGNAKFSGDSHRLGRDETHDEFSHLRVMIHVG